MDDFIITPKGLTLASTKTFSGHSFYFSPNLGGRAGKNVTCDPSQLAFVEVSHHAPGVGPQAHTNDVDGGF